MHYKLINPAASLPMNYCSLFPFQVSTLRWSILCLTLPMGTFQLRRLRGWSGWKSPWRTPSTQPSSWQSVPPTGAARSPSLPLALSLSLLWISMSTCLFSWPLSTWPWWRKMWLLVLRSSTCQSWRETMQKTQRSSMKLWTAMTTGNFSSTQTQVKWSCARAGPGWSNIKGCLCVHLLWFFPIWLPLLLSSVFTHHKGREYSLLFYFKFCHPSHLRSDPNPTEINGKIPPTCLRPETGPCESGIHGEQDGKIFPLQNSEGSVFI